MAEYRIKFVGLPTVLYTEYVSVVDDKVLGFVRVDTLL